MKLMELPNNHMGENSIDFTMDLDESEFYPPSPVAAKTSANNATSKALCENGVIKDAKSKANNIGILSQEEPSNKKTCLNGETATEDNAAEEKQNESIPRQSPAPSTISESDEIKLVYSSESEEEQKNADSNGDMERTNAVGHTNGSVSVNENVPLDSAEPEQEEIDINDGIVETMEVEVSSAVETDLGINSQIPQSQSPPLLEELLGSSEEPSSNKVDTIFSNTSEIPDTVKSDAKPQDSDTISASSETCEITPIDEENVLSESMVGVLQEESSDIKIDEQGNVYDECPELNEEIIDESSAKSPLVKSDEENDLLENDSPTNICDDVNQDSKPVSKREEASEPVQNFFEESIDISDNSQDGSENVAKIIKALENDDIADSVSSLERCLEGDDISKVDNVDVVDSTSNTSPNLEVSKDKVAELSHKNEESASTTNKTLESIAEDISAVLKPAKISETSLDNDKNEDTDRLESVQDISNVNEIDETKVMDIEESESNKTRDESNDIPASKESELKSDTLTQGKSRSKRSLEVDDKSSETTSKKAKVKTGEESEDTSEPERSSARLRSKSLRKENSPQEIDKSALANVKKFFNIPQSVHSAITRMSRKDLEKLVLSKTLETLSLRSQLAKKRQDIIEMQDRVAEYKSKLQPLNKQVHDMSNVLLRIDQALAKNSKPTKPLKVTRSVGLQVSFSAPSNMTPKMSANAGPMRQDGRGVRTLRPVQRPPLTPVPATSPMKPQSESSSPQRAEIPKPIRVAVPNSGIRTLVPAATAMSSNSSPGADVRTPTSGATPILARIGSSLSSLSPVLASTLQAPSPNQMLPGSVLVPRQNNRCIDLTDVEDRSAQMAKAVAASTPPFNYSGNYSLIPPQGGGKQGASPVAFVVQSSQFSRPVLFTPSTQTPGQNLASLGSLALNSPMSTVQWVKNMQPNLGGGAPTNVIRPIGGAATNNRQNQVAVRSTAHVLPVQRNSLYAIAPPNRAPPPYTAPRMQHPAPLPPVPLYPPSRPGWKAPPPKPVLKISRVPNGTVGIVLSWNMSVVGEYEDMKSYQIYAYQESKDPPNSSLWKTVGDVKALALPMACTLTQFKEGHKYHFSVRAVDIHSRMGPHSDPTSIVLTSRSNVSNI